MDGCQDTLNVTLCTGIDCILSDQIAGVCLDKRKAISSSLRVSHSTWMDLYFLWVLLLVEDTNLPFRVSVWMLCVVDWWPLQGESQLRPAGIDAHEWEPA